MPNFVGGRGNREARIAIIGEASGKRELLEGKCFVGPSGKLLWALLARLGVSEDSTYATNLIKTASPSDPLRSMSYSSLEQWRRVLHIELSQLSNCNVYLALGATALWALTDLGIGSITNWRGSLLRTTFDQCKMIASLHPANILRSPENLHLLQRDLAVAVFESISATLTEQREQYKIFPTLAECLEALALARSAGEYAFDIETARGGICTCISFAWGTENKAICIPLSGVTYWNAQDFSVILKALQATLGDPTCTKIGQNVSYDIIGLKSLGLEVKPPIEDTMHMHHAIDPDPLGTSFKYGGEDQKKKKAGGHSLAFQASMYTNRSFWKEWDIAPDTPLAAKLDEHFDYNCRDSDGTLELKRTYYSKFPKSIDFYTQRYKPLLPRLLQMYEDGLCVNHTLAINLASELRYKGAKLESVVSAGLGVDNFNVNSPQAVSKVLYDLLALPVQYKRIGYSKKPTVDDEALVNLYLETQNPFILGIRDAKEQYKLATFLDPKSPDARRKRRSWDTRLRSEYKLTTGTGRLSASASVATGIGINLQQIPGLVRQVVVPQPGYIFLEPDYSQMQARIIAWDSIDLDMMHFLELSRGDPKTYDIHWYNAELTLEQPRTLLSLVDRNCCKHVVYGTYFDMKARKLQATVLKYTEPPVYIDLLECRRRQDVFKSKVPKSIERQERIKREVLTTGRQVSPSGRVVTYHDVIFDDLKYYFGRRDYSEVLRSAYAMVPQDIEALLVNRALVAIDETLRFADLGRVALQVHDSLLLEIRDTPEALERAFELIKPLMEEPYILRGNEMIIPIECKLGYHWPCGQPECKREDKDIRTLDQLLNAYRKLER